MSSDLTSFQSVGAGPPVTGVARVDARTKNLVKRLKPGDIAVIDHEDLDRVAAEGLAESGIVAVINAAACISGRYPNVGPLILARAGVAVVDSVGPRLTERVRDGAAVRIEGERILVDDEPFAVGRRQTTESMEALIELAKSTIGAELARFAENTLEYMQAEQYLLLDSPDVPDVGVPIRGRHVLIAVRGDQFREDLAALSAYIRDLRPVIIGVDGGADALLKAGHRPDLIVGDFDSVSTEALHCGAELIVHAYPDGRAPGASRLDAAGVPYSRFALTGTSEDVAMLLAYEKGADLIVAVGTHANLVDFLDKGRPGMASTFLTRLKVGAILVDAKGVNRLYQPRVRKLDLTMLVTAGLLVTLLVMAFSPPFRVFWRSLWAVWNQ